jgi:hypothetical protein
MLLIGRAVGQLHVLVIELEMPNQQMSGNRYIQATADRHCKGSTGE